MNDRLRTAMLRADVDATELARVASVDIKTVSRWLDGRVPHQRTRIVVAQRLGEEPAILWPTSRMDLAPGSEATSEVVGAWAHRSDVPAQLWTGLITNVKERLDLLGYSFPFLLESMPDAVERLARRCDEGLRVRIAVADPDCEHVMERDTLEQLGGTLAGRIRLSLMWLREFTGKQSATVGVHSVHLYNSVFRFDDQMVVTPHLFRAHGYQHPALHLRRHSAYGIFESFAEQFQQVWDTVRSVGDVP